MSSEPLKFNSSVAGSAYGKTNESRNKAETANSVVASSSTAATTTTALGKQNVTKPEDISSPHELTAYVENLLSQLEARFDDTSSQILDRMGQMSSRVDALEGAIHDLINGDVAGPPTPSTPGLAPGSALQRQSLSDSGT